MLASKLMSAVTGDNKTYVDDVFSAYAYTGNGTTQTITNGIDLAGKGGMVWTKNRSSRANVLVDTIRGINSALISESPAAAISAVGIYNFNSDGYSIDTSDGANQWNSAESFVSWTFRQSPKFFGMVQYSGNSSEGGGQYINNPLSVAPGMIIIKCITSEPYSTGWAVWHRSTGTDYPTVKLNSAGNNTVNGIQWASGSNAVLVGAYPSGTDTFNTWGQTYIAYFFAHDTDTTDGFIQCGEFYTDTSANATVSLGWEPQYVMAKRLDSSGDWFIADTARFISGTSVNSHILRANAITAEVANASFVQAIATGFKANIASSATYIYMAIRRSNKPPTVGTQVYNAIARTGTGAAATVTGVGFAPDLVTMRGRTVGYTSWWSDRLRGATKNIASSTTDAEITASGVTAFGMDGISLGADSGMNPSSTACIDHFFKRALGVFDIVCYSGNSVSNRSVTHSLGVVPEMVILKNRSSVSSWPVFHKDLSVGEAVVLQHTIEKIGASSFGDFIFTSTVFKTNNESEANQTGKNYVAYLFATKAGISKVGSYTGNGGTQTINCGFTTGARFILIKRTDLSGDWYVWDSARNIIAGNAPHLSLNTTVAEVTTDDSVDPETSGFIVNQVAIININVASATYIFLAFA